MNATVSGTALGGSSQAFKLQYATDTGGPWTDVGTGEGTLVLVNPNTQVADQLTGLSGTTPTDTELVGLELSTTSTTSTVSEIVVNLSYTGIVDGDVDNFRLYKDLGTIGTYESGTDTLVDTVAGNPTSGTVTFASLSESIGISPTHYLIIYDFANALSASDQITASIGPADITTTAAAKSGDLTNEPTHTATASGSVGFTDYTATAGVGNVGTAFAITWEDYDNVTVNCIRMTEMDQRGVSPLPLRLPPEQGVAIGSMRITAVTWTYLPLYRDTFMTTTATPRLRKEQRRRILLAAILGPPLL
jgi:hypothetical protein